MSLAGSCFSTESAHRLFHHGIGRQGGAIFRAALPIVGGRSKRTCELTSSIVPRGTSFHHWGGARVSSHYVCCCAVMLPQALWSSGTRCRQPRCDAGSRPAVAPTRFRKSKSVGAVFGLTCSRDQSGERDRPGAERICLRYFKQSSPGVSLETNLCRGT
jgi:hypothetical protein